VEEVTLPDPGPHQVLIKQYASGICHSQLHEIHQSRKTPLLLGHESTGVVLQTGAEVSHVQPGDTVMVTWVPRDVTATDRRIPGFAVDLSNGGQAQTATVFTWADHTIADEQYVVKAEPGIAREVTSIIGCAVMTGAGAVENTAGVKAGDSVAIFGVGGVGLSAVAAAKQLGADPIIAVDLDDEKLAFARRFGATHTINAQVENPIKAIRALTTRNDQRNLSQQPVAGADFVFDCIGTRQTMEQIVPAARSGHFGVESGGTAVLVGVPNTPVELNAIDVLINEKKFIGSIGGSCRPERDFPKYLHWFDTGALDLNALVSARYSIDQINAATAALEEGQISGRAILVFDHSN
jgi:Zn-dependent alcohol dehydrogenase